MLDCHETILTKRAPHPSPAPTHTRFWRGAGRGGGGGRTYQNAVFRKMNLSSCCVLPVNRAQTEKASILFPVDLLANTGTASALPLRVYMAVSICDVMSKADVCGNCLLHHDPVFLFSSLLKDKRIYLRPEDFKLEAQENTYRISNSDITTTRSKRTRPAVFFNTVRTTTRSTREHDLPCFLILSEQPQEAREHDLPCFLILSEQPQDAQENTTCRVF